MKTIKYPSLDTWGELTERPQTDQSSIEETVKGILTKVSKEGDNALKDFTEKFDGFPPEALKVSAKEIQDSEAELTQDLKDAIQLAAKNIEAFHKNQIIEEKGIETMPGVYCYRKSLPIERVGLYVPGGTAPLFSSLLMLAIPAKLVGVEKIVICSPPNRDGKLAAAIRYVAKYLGLSDLYAVGGAQAIAAMAYGTESLPKVDKIFGPGNRYVTLAKQLVLSSGVAIDMPAGPSEVLVVADSSSNPAFVTSDLLSQAEHGVDSQVILVLSEEAGNLDHFLAALEKELEKQLEVLPRKEIAQAALLNSRIILFETELEAMNFSNTYAPEHLILATHNPNKIAKLVRNAGSVFVGSWSCESAGDYASGTNHTLPTNGYARSYSGVSTDSFVKKITFQELSEKGIQNIGKAVEIMAEAEGLAAHKNAVSIRLKALRDAD